jgi:hypothetical protein
MRRLGNATSTEPFLTRAKRLNLAIGRRALACRGRRCVGLTVAQGRTNATARTGLAARDAQTLAVWRWHSGGTGGSSASALSAHIALTRSLPPRQGRGCASPCESPRVRGQFNDSHSVLNDWTALTRSRAILAGDLFLPYVKNSNLLAQDLASCLWAFVVKISVDLSSRLDECVRTRPHGSCRGRVTNSWVTLLRKQL